MLYFLVTAQYFYSFVSFRSFECDVKKKPISAIFSVKNRRLEAYIFEMYGQ